MNEEVLKEKESHGTILFPLRVHEFISDSNTIERVALHWHPECELLVVTTGQAVLHLNGQAYPIKETDVIVIQPDQLHAMTAPLGQKFGFYAVVFDPILLQSAIPDAIQQNFLNQPLQINPVLNSENIAVIQLRKKLRQIRILFEQQPLTYMLEIKGILFLAWTLLFQMSKQHTQSVRDSDGNAFVITKKIMSYIHHHYSQPLSLSFLATEFNISKSYLCHIFKMVTKKTVTDYINTKRISASTILLRQTNESISAIAGEVGFNNISYFNKIFQQKLNITPTVYRQHHSHSD